MLALRALQHTVTVIPLHIPLDELAEQLRIHQPQCVLSLDGAGLAYESIKKSNVVRIAWFVDNPYYFDILYDLNDRDIILVWDDEYVYELKERGMRQVYFMPLATNASRFHDAPITDDDMRRYASDVSFVGSVGPRVETVRAARIAQSPEAINQLADHMITATMQIYNKANAREALGVLRATYAHLQPKERAGIGLAIDSEINAIKRHEVLEVLCNFNAGLYGDECLQSYAGEHVHCEGRIDYKTVARTIYKASAIVVNATRPQLRMTVNQRIFDVFSCGGFLLTDYRTYLDECLPGASDRICFYSQQDLLEKIRYYLAHPQERAEITAYYQKYVRAKHTYIYRMEELQSYIHALIG